MHENKTTNAQFNPQSLCNRSLSTHHVRVDLGRLAKRHNAPMAVRHAMLDCYDDILNINIQQGRSCVYKKKLYGAEVKMRKSSPRESGRPFYTLVEAKMVD